MRKRAAFVFYEVEFLARDGDWHGIGIVFQSRSQAESWVNGRARYRVSDARRAD